MGTYRPVHTRLWYDESFSQLSPSDKLVAIYILTNPSTNGLGFYCFSLGECAECVGHSPDTVLNNVRRVCDSLSWAYDEQARVMLIPNWIKYHPQGSPKVWKGWLSALDEMPQTKLWPRFIECMKEHAPDIEIPNRYAIDTLSDKGKVKVKVKVKGKKPPKPPSGPSVVLPFESDEFSEAWDAFCESRRKVRAPMTDRAKQLILKKLDGLNENQAIACLNESTSKGWKGVFPENLTATTPETKSRWQQS